MPDVAAPEEVRVPLTRRRIREAERAAHDAQRAGAAHGDRVRPFEGPPPSEQAGVGGRRRPSHAYVAAGLPTEELVQISARSRREARSRSTREDVDRRPRRLVARATVLTALGLTTIAVPVLGIDGSDHSAHAHESAVASVQPEPNVLDVLDSQVAAAEPSNLAPPSLLADPAARARAEWLQASRAAQRGALDGADLQGAHGTLAAAVPEKRIVMPLPRGSFRTTSPYGGRPDPFTGGASTHTGVDLAAPLDTPIHAVADGVVDYVGPGKDGRSSMIIVVRHEIDGRTVYSWYNHMYARGLYVQVGQQVRAGDVIAGVGNNGRSTGPHVHFEIHTDDDLTTTDPLVWLREQGAVDVSELP